MPGMLRHDFRRGGAQQERHDVPRSVATKLPGHKTEAVFRRYAIVSDADLRDAALRFTSGEAAREHSFGHVEGGGEGGGG